jgi:hypothetical protein
MIKDLVNLSSFTDFLKWIIIFTLVLLIYVLIIRFLWNTVLVKHITVLRPVDKLLDTFLLAIALSLFSGSCMCKS